ncbi:MAG: X2-like carbohydrate binding domain-containing protein, partial [Anaerotignum sp.]|nr:X2-like carbohydrate binding domain-containing protein [Anaerotignum sp.]
MNARKILAVLLSLLMLLTTGSVTAFAETGEQTSVFQDMPDNWSTTALNRAVENGLLKGSKVNGKTLILPDAPLTRAEMAAVVNRAFAVAATTELKDVMDVPSSAWYAKDMAKAVQMGTFVLDGMMRPENNITRQEAFAVLARAFKLTSADTDFLALRQYSDTSDIADWAKNALSAMAEEGYIKGGPDGKLNPNANITRAEFAVVMNNLVKQYIDTPGEVTEVVVQGNVMVRVPGVILKSATIKGDLIIGDGVGNGEATLEDITVAGRTVVRGGGVNSVIVRGNSFIGKIIVSRADGNVRIAVESGADVDYIYVDDGSDDVIVTGHIGTLEVSANDIIVKVTDAVIENGLLSGENSKLIVEKSSSVEVITVRGANTEVSGEGKVTAVKVEESGDFADISTPNTKIETAPNTNGVTGGGGNSIGAGSNNTNNNDGTGIVVSKPSSGGGGGGGSHHIAVASITVNGEGDASTITQSSGTLQMTASVAPANATNKNVVWSVINGTGEATISATGLLTAIKNGTVTVKATAADGSGKFGQKEITITNQEPTISTTSTIHNGDENPTIVVNLVNDTFTADAELPTNWTGTLGATGLHGNSIARNSDTQVTFQLSGTASAGALTLQANASALTGGVASNTLTITVPDADAPQLLSAATNTEGTEIHLAFDKAMADPNGKHDQFAIMVNGSINPATAVARKIGDNSTLALTLTNALTGGETITAAYTQGDVEAADSGILSTFSAQAVTNLFAATYSVTYHDNGATSGTVPSDATGYHNLDEVSVLGNTGSLEKTGFTFAGWNTQANGQGTTYATNDNFSISSNTTLYAIWESSNAGLTSVASQTDNAPAGGDGTQTNTPITWAINVSNGKTSLALADVAVADHAAFALYSNAAFTTEIQGASTLSLEMGGTTAYIKVTAEDGIAVKYYAVTITRALPAQSGAPAFTGGTPATYDTQLSVGTGSLGIQTNLTYSWYRSEDAAYNDGTDTSLGSGTTYTPVSADVGKYLIVVALSADASENGIVATSAATAKALGTAFTADYAGAFPAAATSINLTGLGASTANLEAAVAIDGTNYAAYADLIVDVDGKATISGLTGVTAATKVKVGIKETATHLAGMEKEITVTEEVFTDASISPTTGAFDKNTNNQADVETTITWNSVTSVSAVKNGTTTLTETTDYAVSGNTLTIKKEYLTTLSEGSTSLTVEFNAGNAATLTITISDTTPVAPTGDLLDAAGASNFTGVLYARSGSIYFNQVDTSGTWGTEVLIGTGTEGSLSFDSSNHPHVAYTTSGSIGYRMYDGDDWSDEELLSSNNGGSCFKPDIAVDSNGYAHITYTDTMGNTYWYQNKPDIMYATNATGSFIKALIFDGYYENTGGSGYIGNFFEYGSFIALDSNDDYYIMTEKRDFYKPDMQLADNTYSVVVKKNPLDASNQDSIGSVAGASSNIYGIYDLTFSNNKLIALYKHTTLKTAELTDNSGTITFDNISEI